MSRNKEEEMNNILWEDLNNGIWEQENGSLPSTIEKAKQYKRDIAKWQCIDINELPEELQPCVKKLQNEKTDFLIALSMFHILKVEKNLPKEKREQVQKLLNKVPTNMIFKD